MAELLHLVDEDTDAFNQVMAAFAMSKGTEEERTARSEAIQAATLYAAEVPLRTMRAALNVLPICEQMARQGNPNSISDAGVGALAARAAVIGAGLNVRINAASLKDRDKADKLVAEAEHLIAEAEKQEKEILQLVMQRI